MRRLYVGWKLENSTHHFMVLAESLADAKGRIKIALGLGSSVALHAELCVHGTYIISATFLDK